MDARARGVDESELVAREFAEMRLFDDLRDNAKAIRLKAIGGVLSEVTLALVERDGYCQSVSFCTASGETVSLWRLLLVAERSSEDSYRMSTVAGRKGPAW